MVDVPEEACIMDLGLANLVCVLACVLVAQPQPGFAGLLPLQHTYEEEEEEVPVGTMGSLPPFRQHSPSAD